MNAKFLNIHRLFLANNPESLKEESVKEIFGDVRKKEDHYLSSKILSQNFLWEREKSAKKFNAVWYDLSKIFGILDF